MRSGTTIAHYKIGDLLGQGGMGDVYRAVDTRLDRPVALKFLASRFVSEQEAKERFIREAKAASALDHPNICTIHDIGETEDGDLYIVMALYEGATLQDRLKSETFSVDRTVSIIRQLAEALKRAHAGGIIHRDIKPANTMVSDEDAVRLLDFGVAKLQSAESLTQTGMSVGTAVYMSPEQATGDPVSPASDVWSLGVMAHEMLRGDVPFKGENPLAMLNQILTVEAPDLSTARPDVPQALGQVLSRALAKSPEDRFSDAAEFLDALNGAVGQGPTTSYASPTVGAHGGLRRWLVPAIGIVAVAALAVQFFGSGPTDSDLATAELSNDLIAVLPFEVSGSAEQDLDYLAQGLIQLVGGRLDDAGSLRTVNARAIVGRMEEGGFQSLDEQSGAELASSLGAGRFVLGDVLSLPGRVSLSASLHEIGAGTEDPPVITVEGPVDSLLVLVDNLATALLESSLTGANARIQRSASQSSGSLQATKEFLQGEQFHRAGQFDSASAAYNRALAIDSMFALAHLMKSMNNAYTYETDDFVAAEKAMQYSEGLPERDRSLISAFLDQQSGRLDEARQAYLTHLQRYPDEVKALLQLGIIYQGSNQRWGRPIYEARPYFEQVLALEPENVPSLHRLSRLDGAERRYETLGQWAQTLGRVAPESEWATDAETIAAFALGDTATIEGLVQTYPDESLLVRLYSAYNAARFSADPRDADRLLARQGTGQLNPDTGLPDGIVIGNDIALSLVVLVDIFAGRYGKVRDHLQNPTRPRTPTWNVWDAELIVSDVVPVDSVVKAEALARLRDVDPEERLRTLFEPIHDIFTPAIATLERDVNIAKLLGRLGDMEEAWAIQRRLAALPPFRAFESLHEDAAAGLAADLHHLAGDDNQALEILREQRFQVPLTANSLSITNGPHARFLRAELELEYGDSEVARHLYDGLVGSFAPVDKFFLAPAYERLGQIHERAGRLDDAAYFYEKLLSAWSEADAELVPRREAAQERLEALPAGTGSAG